MTIRCTDCRPSHPLSRHPDEGPCNVRGCRCQGFAQTAEQRLKEMRQAERRRRALEPKVSHHSTICVFCLGLPNPRWVAMPGGIEVRCPVCGWTFTICSEHSDLDPWPRIAEHQKQPWCRRKP